MVCWSLNAQELHVKDEGSIWWDSNHQSRNKYTLYFLSVVHGIYTQMVNILI